MDKQTLFDTDRETYAVIMSLAEQALKNITEPDYISVNPLPENKAPGYLIYYWGIEMFKAGLEKGLALTEISREKGVLNEN